MISFKIQKGAIYMGFLVEGEWRDEWYDTDATDGEFVREEVQFRDWIKADGTTPFTPERGRYHLYVSYACPWAHRTLIFRKLKGLEDIISISVVDPFMGEDGWFFSDAPKAIPDQVNGVTYLRDIYLKAKSDYTGHVTVPVLWDKKTETIVNNESSEIIRIFNSAFDELTGSTLDFYPEELREQIDILNEEIYENVNNGVYQCGFATSQEAYEDAFSRLFGTLDKLETILSKQSYLCGEQVTEADLRLLPTLLRFDPVYYGHFKCNLRRLAEYEHLSHYMRALYQGLGLAEITHIDHIKEHYYSSHETINPTRIVPKGPVLRYDAPHNRKKVTLRPA